MSKKQQRNVTNLFVSSLLSSLLLGQSWLGDVSFCYGFFFSFRSFEKCRRPARVCVRRIPLFNSSPQTLKQKGGKGGEPKTIRKEDRQTDASSCECSADASSTHHRRHDTVWWTRCWRGPQPEASKRVSSIINIAIIIKLVESRHVHNQDGGLRRKKNDDFDDDDASTSAFDSKYSHHLVDTRSPAIPRCTDHGSCIVETIVPNGYEE